MLLDIFSGFDDHQGVWLPFFFVWWAVFLFIMIMGSPFWVSNNIVSSLKSVAHSVAAELVKRSQAIKSGGSSVIFASFFLFLFQLNIWGLVPYVFSVTSHLSMNLALSLPLWFCVVMMAFSYDLSSFMAHLQPSGSPSALNPFLCTIELLSLTIRPLTLAVRLTANLSTGHILMALLGVGFCGSSLAVKGLLLVLGSGYFMFEMAVCVIQAYIFTLLPTLYADEHPEN